MKYDVHSKSAEGFINDSEIKRCLTIANEYKNDSCKIDEILKKAKLMQGLSHLEAAILLECDIKEKNDEIFSIAKEIKKIYYGNRIVIFAPLYLSNYCVNGCVYCPYHFENKHIPRKKLTQEEIKNEVIALEDMGHKRIAIETGEDPINIPIEYILESIDTIYKIKHKNGSIRRANINIAATTTENYKKLKNAEIGTYILFQETYNRKSYEKLHPTGPKHDYNYHTTAMDRAIEAGIDDVGCGVLFGLELYKYDFLGLLLHKEHLETVYGVGPHTISVPRIRRADDIDPNSFGNGIDDETFAKIIACLRIAVPYAGMIISTREDQNCREKVLELGISQISGGSKTSVGGYTTDEDKNKSSSQFEISDNRNLDDIVRWLIELDHIPSFCTACYRKGRTGEKFMTLCKEKQIGNCCHPNAILTLNEYLIDYASCKTKIAGQLMIKTELDKIVNPKLKEQTLNYLDKINHGLRDFKI